MGRLIQRHLLVLHPHLVPHPAGGLLVDSTTGARITLPASLLALASAFVTPADPERVLAARATGADHSDGRSQLAGLLRRGLLVSAFRLPPPRMGLFDAPRTTLAQALASPGPMVVVCAMPYDAGTSGRPGTRDAPQAIREASTDLYCHDPLVRAGWCDPVLDRVILEGVGLADVGDLAPVLAARNGPSFDALAGNVELIIAGGAFPVVLGGDHSLALAAIRGAARARPGIGVLHLDAHADVDVGIVFGGESGSGSTREPTADASGASGAPDEISADDGRSDDWWRTVLHHGNVMTFVAAEPNVASLVQVGMRQRSPVPVPVPAGTRRLPGVVGVVDVLAAMDPNLDWYVSLDVDVLDPSALRGTGTPLPGGFTARELADLLAGVIAARTVIGLDVCELIPDHPSEVALVADLILQILAAALPRH